MAYLNKDEYQRRANYAGRRMEENAKISTLTPGQHEALKIVCTMRHTIHSSRAEVILWNEESADHDAYWASIGTECGENALKILLNAVSLPEWDWTCNELDYITSSFSEDYDAEIAELAHLVNEWNNSVENYLRTIDKAHGTHYCPTGMSRI